jgi:hypothetical protein
MYEKHINQFKPIFYQEEEEEENQTPLRLFYQQTKEEKKIKPLFDYKFGSFVAVDYFHSLRLVDTYIRALSFYVGNLFPYFSLGGH